MNYLIYKGKSHLTDAPIVAIMTGIDRISDNEKTGPVAQVWVFVDETNPITAVKTGEDEAVCGSCALRKNVCYVNLSHGPLNIWKSYKSNPDNFAIGFPPYAKTKRRIVRLTAYGDVAALPLSVVEECVSRFKSTLGYTHSWRERPELARFVMASVETPELAAEAQAIGFRTYRIKASAEEPRLKGEALCPYESPAKLQCVDCGACNGKAGPFTSNIVVTIHGIAPKINGFRRLVAQPQTEPL